MGGERREFKPRVNSLSPHFKLPKTKPLLKCYGINRIKTWCLHQDVPTDECGETYRILPRGIQTEISTWLLFQITARTFARALCSESGLRNNICQPLKNMSDSGAKYFSGQRQQMVSAFCWFLFGSLDMQPSPGQCDRSELGEEKLLKSHHSGLWTGSASAQGAHSQLNPCSDATLQLEPSHRARKIFSTFICNINSWYWLQEQYSGCINTLKGHYT